MSDAIPTILSPEAAAFLAKEEEKEQQLRNTAAAELERQIGLIIEGVEIENMAAEWQRVNHHGGDPFDHKSLSPAYFDAVVYWPNFKGRILAALLAHPYVGPYAIFNPALPLAILETPDPWWSVQLRQHALGVFEQMLQATAVPAEVADRLGTDTWGRILKQLLLPNSINSNGKDYKPMLLKFRSTLSPTNTFHGLDPIAAMDEIPWDIPAWMVNATPSRLIDMMPISFHGCAILKRMAEQIDLLLNHPLGRPIQIKGFHG